MNFEGLYGFAPRLLFIF